MKPIMLISGFFTVGAWTLLSRVLGFIREVMILAFLGTGPLYVAYVTAFRLPNMFRRILAEGAFNTAFLPMFSKKLETGEDAQGFAQDAYSGLATILIALTLIAMLAMPWLIYGLAPGFLGQEQFGISIEFGRIVFPYIIFVSLAALLSGVLNATGRFMATAAAPILLNVLLVLAMGVADRLGGDIARAIIWTIPIAGIAQFSLLWIAAKRAGFPLALRRPRVTPDLRKLIRIAIPAALAGGVLQINLLVGHQVASQFDRAVGWLYAADRLYQLPLGVVGISIGIVLLPDLSRRLKAGDDAGGREILSRAAEVSLSLTIPSAVALTVVPLSLVTVLFERGATTSEDSAAIALAVAIYSLGLPAFVLQRILQPLYFAREDTHRPFLYALVSVVLNASLAISLAHLIGSPLGWIGPAISTTVAAWVMVALLAAGARSMGDVARFDARFHYRIWRIIAASAAMGAVIWTLDTALSPLFEIEIVRYVALLTLVMVGMGSYAVFGQMWGAFKISEFRSALKGR